MRQAGLKDSFIRGVRISYAYDLFPDKIMTKTFKTQKEYLDWTMSPEAQRYHITEIVYSMYCGCKIFNDVASQTELF